MRLTGAKVKSHGEFRVSMSVEAEFHEKGADHTH